MLRPEGPVAVPVPLAAVGAVQGPPGAVRGPRTHPAGTRGWVPGDLSGRARLLASLLLGSSGDRWRHTRAVAHRARQAVPAVLPSGGAAAAEALVAAAWLHDIGYASPLHRSGYHAADGAEHLRATGWPEIVVSLVAHHSGARFVADVLGLPEVMAPFDDPRGWAGPLADALTWADQTSGPAGGVVTVDARLAEVLERHGADSALGRCHAVRSSHIRMAAAATETRLSVARLVHLAPAARRSAWEPSGGLGAERTG